MHAAEIKVRPQADLARQARRGDHEARGGNDQADAAEVQADAGHRQRHDPRAVRPGHLLERHIAGQRLLRDGEVDVRSLEAEVRAGHEVQRVILAADREGLVDCGVGVVDGHADRAGQAHAGNRDGDAARDTAGEARRRGDEQRLTVAEGEEVARAIADADVDVRRRDLHHRDAAGEGRPLERVIAADALARNLQHDVCALDLHIRPGRDGERARLGPDLELLVHFRRGVVDGQSQRPGALDTRDVQRDGAADAAREPPALDDEVALALREGDHAREVERHVRRGNLDDLRRSAVANGRARVLLEGEVSGEPLPYDGERDIQALHLQVRPGGQRHRRRSRQGDRDAGRV